MCVYLTFDLLLLFFYFIIIIIIIIIIIKLNTKMWESGDLLSNSV